ncbi:hypothetical protein [Nonomuraea sp. LPB2021202275-12-8]|uniref:hypothetical protein n=1 Tax=Nonomuraea sp. LPB2021202275-12-8 TaxID=3120159 RepID=UPI00300CFB28
MRTRTFLLVASGSALALPGLLALPPVREFLLDRGGLLGRVLSRALVFPGVGQAPAASTVAGLVAFALAVAGGTCAISSLAGFGTSRWRGLVCWGLAGGPAGVLAVLVWSLATASEESVSILFGGQLKYAAWWGTAVGLLTGVLVRAVPAVAERGTGTFHGRRWVTPCLVFGWAVIWSVLLSGLYSWERPFLGLLAWLPLTVGYLRPFLVFFSAVVAALVEGMLRQWLPVDGRPGRAFVFSWIALCTAPLTYAIGGASDGGMRDLLVADPLDLAWVAEYVEDIGAALVADPAQVAVPPLLLALAGTGLQRVLPRRTSEPDPIRPDRPWGLLVALGAVMATYLLVTVVSAVPALTGRAFDEDLSAAILAFGFLTPPDEAPGQDAGVWFWTVAVAFASLSAVVAYVAVRGQVIRLVPATAWLVLAAGLALAVQVAWNAGGVIAPAITGWDLLGIALVPEAAAFTLIVVPGLATVLWLVHLMVTLSRVRRAVDLDAYVEDDDDERAWDELVARHRDWRQRVRAYAPDRRERALIAAKAAGAALLVTVVAGAFLGFGHGLPVGQVAVRASEPFLALPVLSAVPRGDWALEILTAVLYVALLAGLVHLGLRGANVRERRLSAGLAVWSLSVVAGGLAMLIRAQAEAAWSRVPPGDLIEAYSGVGLQFGLIAGLPVAVGTLITVRRPVLLCGAAVLLVVALAPLARPAAGSEQITITAAHLRESRDPRLTVDASYPLARGGDVTALNAALMAPIGEAVRESARINRDHPPAVPQDSRVTGAFEVVRNDTELVSVRYGIIREIEGLRPVESGYAVNYDRAAGRALTTREVFTPSAFSRAGRARLALAIRSHTARAEVANLESAGVDDALLLVNLGTSAVEFTFVRGYFCNACASFTVRMPPERLRGLLRPCPLLGGTRGCARA